MPLSCDCYGGCWGDHAADWIRIFGEERVLIQEAQHTLPYGSYVWMGDHLRVETEEHLKALKKPRIVIIGSRPGCFAVRFVTFTGAQYEQVNWWKSSRDEAFESLRKAYFWNQVLWSGKRLPAEVS